MRQTLISCKSKSDSSSRKFFKKKSNLRRWFKQEHF